jgi:hypothetical protein
MSMYLSDKKVANARSPEGRCSFTIFLSSIIRIGVHGRNYAGRRRYFFYFICFNRWCYLEVKPGIR